VTKLLIYWRFCKSNRVMPLLDLKGWLARIEAIHEKPIDMGLERVREVAQKLAIPLERSGHGNSGASGPIKILVAGTNGKGSTCAMLEAICLAAGYKVATYTSPHLIDFNERARINGEPVDDAALIEQFEAVDAVRGMTSLTYFEFTTLAILKLFAQAAVDVQILEIGLGGRLDAVNIIEPDCSIVTCIDIDHAQFLGDTREKIAIEKAHVYRSGRPAICSDPVAPKSLIDYADSIGADLWLFGRDFNYSGDKQQWSFAGRENRRNSLAYPALRGANQLLNASGVLAALDSLRQVLPVSAGAIRQGLAVVDIPGRFQVVPGRPTVILDVAHNPHAVGHLATNLDNMGFFPYTYAVVGMLADKDIHASLARIVDKVDHWLLCTLPGPRGASADALAAALTKLGVRHGENEKTVTLILDIEHAPSAGLMAARAAASEADRILVFGSFLTVADSLLNLRQ
jgi:dihydrofolate synthase / folylpolyglutamate synthase